MKEFIKDVITSGSGKSSKRVAGILILIAELTTMIICTFFAIPISPALITLHSTLVYIGAALLGLGVLDKLKINNKINE